MAVFLQIRNRPIKTSVWCCNIIDKKAFEHNVQRDPKNKPERDIKTERPNWGKYPVIFGEKMKNAIVTGASNGIGLEISKNLVKMITMLE